MQKLTFLFTALLLTASLVACTIPVISTPPAQSTINSPTITQSVPKIITPTPLPTEVNQKPSGVSVAPNLSLIRATVLSLNQTSSGIVLRIKIISSEAKPGFLNFGTKLIGQEVDVLWLEQNRVTVSVNQTISGELSYQGDEKGGNYVLTKVVIVP